MKKRTLHILVTAGLVAIALFSVRGPLQHAQGERAQGGDDDAVRAINAPTDKAAYYSHGDMETIWKDLEAKQVNNHRVMEGGKYSINVRIVKPNSTALTHVTGADIWLCEAGSAVAITGGTLVNAKKPKGDNIAGASIDGGTEQTLMPGDILYVPPGVPHTFKDMKGFRAYLIRFDVK